MKGKLAAATSTLALLVFSFAVMPSALATAPEISEIQTVTGNTAALNESDSAATGQMPNVNAITKEQAVDSALKSLESSGFDSQDFRTHPVETRYIPEIAPAGDPVWAVIFRGDQEGYTYAFGSDMSDEIRDKIAAIGEVEACTDEKGIPGIRAHYSYTEYTLVEINALNGEYVRHGTAITELGELLNMDETKWVLSAEEELFLERQKQEHNQHSLLVN